MIGGKGWRIHGLLSLVPPHLHSGEALRGTVQGSSTGRTYRWGLWLKKRRTAALVWPVSVLRPVKLFWLWLCLLEGSCTFLTSLVSQLPTPVGRWIRWLQFWTSLDLRVTSLLNCNEMRFSSDILHFQNPCCLQWNVSCSWWVKLSNHYRNVFFGNFLWPSVQALEMAALKYLCQKLSKEIPP